MKNYSGQFYQKSISFLYTQKEEKKFVADIFDDDENRKKSDTFLLKEICFVFLQNPDKIILYDDETHKEEQRG